ncbi:hypothetical protein [Sphingobacterium sp. LRF_L2]|uniref:hypothetical protein n=1 Tax=Sphingobacterium sp. LRF_L2 TaxID=3369421 RepID=UPI003F5F4FA8
MNFKSYVALNWRSLCWLPLSFAVLSSCQKSETKPDHLAGGYSIISHEGNVLVNGYENKNDAVHTVYWMNGQQTDSSTFLQALPSDAVYLQANYDGKIVFNALNGTESYQQFRFNPSSSNEGKGSIYYYRDGIKKTMNADSIGTLVAMDSYNGKPFFGGTLMTMKQGGSLYNYRPFVWDGEDSFSELPSPEQGSFVSMTSVYRPDEKSFYASAKYGFPMYWANGDIVILDERYGEVLQLLKSGNDVYAVGLINKFNSNSSRHTAVYWKNAELHELEDNAQASSIYVDGNDVYVTGSTGAVPIDYKPCYWKNGTRVDLPME